MDKKFERVKAATMRALKIGELDFKWLGLAFCTGCVTGNPLKDIADCKQMHPEITTSEQLDEALVRYQETVEHQFKKAHL